jgi:Tfp pilus assembly protein PilF
MPNYFKSRKSCRSLVRLWSLGLLLTLVLTGCAFLGRLVRPGEIPVAEVQETSESLAYYHYLKAQHLMLADDAAGAIREYEAALLEDPYAATMELETAILYQRQGEAKKPWPTWRRL